MTKDGVIIYNVVSGERPPRPPGLNEWVSDDVWNLISSCWTPSRDDRPGVDFIINALNDAADTAEVRRGKMYAANNQGRGTHRKSSALYERRSGARVNSYGQ